MKNMLLLIVLIIVLLFYFVIDRPIGKTHIVRTSLDSRIPLIPAFSIPYLLFLPALLGTTLYAYISNTKFRFLAGSIIIVYLLSYIVFITYQTHVPRPKITSHNFFTKFLEWIYEHDKPYNCFPSTHSSGATVLAVYYLIINSSLGWLAVPLSLVIILSTLFVKQHYIPDAVSGVVLGIIVSLIIFKT
jgi:membrane-associated phospholipid phosphatase